jgi:threonine synthase
MKRVAGYRCTICGKEYPFGPELMTCPSCGEKGILDIVYDYSQVKSVFTKESLNKDNDNSMWRYRALMPLQGEGLSDFLRIGWTPLYRSLRLGRQLGLLALDRLPPLRRAVANFGAGLSLPAARVVDADA